MRVPSFSRLLHKGPARWRAALLAGAAALALAGCTGDDGPSPMSAKGTKSLSPQTVALIGEKGMSRTSPIVVRIFKEESELEVWKQTTSGDYALLKTYPICRWSGELGPKVKEGDRQAPEGFYTVTPGQMNPNSQYYLSFDLGYPNAFDRSLGRTGANLMVHGDCTSRGCYAMTDEQVQEVFALGRESFMGGQRSFQVQAYPFRMTADNMVRHRNNPNLAFWKMIKEGSDTFEVTKAPPKVDFCAKRYVFNATPVDPSARFDASAPCPQYTQPEGLQQALAARQQAVNSRIASAGTLQPTAPVKTGKDGGMHKVFLAKLENPELNAPGSLPAIVKPPGSEWGVETNAPAPAESIALAKADMVEQAANVPLPAPRPTDAPGGLRTQVAAAPQAPSLFGAFAPAPAPSVQSTPAGTQVAALDAGGGFFAGLKSWFGGGSPPPNVPAATASTGTPSDVPLPPERPTARPQTTSTRPATPAKPAPQGQSSAAPRPAAATSASAPQVVPRPTHPGYGATTSTVAAPQATPAAASAADSGEAPVLRPSVASSQQPLFGTPGALPGASILAPGGFSSSVQ
ncbi:MAG: hypothetical protein K0S00_2812 [Xanthobacteraceae bacterium]|nr:hypothetical protein [Xanthobacteraceae bacterium]